MQSPLWSYNLKFLRKKNNKTQSQLAFELDTTQQTIGNWEKGENKPDLYDLLKITSILGVSVDEFLKENLELGTDNSKKTDKNPPIEVKTTKVLLIEEAGMLHKLEEEMKQMRAEYDRRIQALEAQVFLKGWQQINNQLNENEAYPPYNITK